jgi:hypothetical protein
VCIDAAGNLSTVRNGDQWFAQFRPIGNESRTDCLLRFCETGSPRLVSCSGAWTKKMFSAFPPIPPDVWYEDDVVTLRAWLYGRILFMDQPLVKYREHDSNIFNRVTPLATTRAARQRAEHDTATEARRRRVSLLAYLPDLALAVRQQWITPLLYEQLVALVETRCTLLSIIENWWNVPWIRRLASFGFVSSHGRPSEVRWCGTRLLPQPLFLSLGAAWSRLRMLGRSMRPLSTADQPLRGEPAG